MVTKLQVAEYMRDVALNLALGPYGIPKIGMDIFVDTYEGDYDQVARSMAVGAGSMAMGYSMLQMLNYIQGPKYAIRYWDLYRGMGPVRNIFVKSAVTNPAAIAGAAVTGMALMTAARPDLTKHTYQSAMTGQPSIGSAGHELIYGNMKFRM